MVCVSLKSPDGVALCATYITLTKFENTVTFRVGIFVFIEEKY